LDTIVSFFGIDERPTGSRDPFALRRAAIGAIDLLRANDLRVRLMEVTARCVAWINRQWTDVDYDEGLARLDERFPSQIYIDVPAFFADRLKVQQREAGVRHDLIDAVFALGGEDDLVRLLARVRALQAFVETPEGKDLLAGYKRAANILKKEEWPATSSPLVGEDRGGGGDGAPAAAPPPPPPTRGEAEGELSYTPETAETALIAALDSAEPEAAAAVSQEDFEGAMRALATLRGPVDAFFNEVIVNDSDPAKREARLNLLARIRGAVHRVADFSRIEG